MDDSDLLALILLEDEFSEEDEIRAEESDIFKRRNSEGAYEILVRRHLLSNEDKFKEYFRLTPVLFNYVLSYIKDDVTSTPYNRHLNPVTPEQKLCIFLRYLATGESFRSLAFQFRISHSWISNIVKQVAESIVDTMTSIAIPLPTEVQLRKNANSFFSSWNFPNCVGAIDGKHIRIRGPINSGSLFFNDKDFHSIVLLAIVDAECKFVAVDIGSYGREGDAGIFLKSKLGQQIRDHTFNMPPPQALPGMDNLVPHVIVADEAFALHENMMKPYPRNQSLDDSTKAVYNYRLSRARRTSEISFGILCAYFRIFFQPIATAPETTDKLILSACILYNLLREAKVLAPSQICLNDQLPLPNENLIRLSRNNVRSRDSPSEIREWFKTYFNGPGAVDWQNDRSRNY